MSRILQWTLPALVLLFGIITVDEESWKWALIGISFFSFPLLLQMIKSPVIKAWAIWGGIFLVLQSVISPMLPISDMVTLKPNLREVTDVRAGIPGVSGIQKITTDSHGFRTTKQIDYNNKGRYRIVTIGGSTTESIDLDDTRTWPHVLQEQLSVNTARDVEVINTGVSGLRAKNHVATLQQMIPLKPDLVIFLMGFNDWNYQIAANFADKSSRCWTLMRDYREKLSLKNTMLGRTFLRGYHFLTRNSKRPEPSVREEHGEYYKPQRNSLGRPVRHSFHPADVSPDYKKRLAEISALCHQNNLNCVFVTQPTGYRAGADEEFKRGFWMTPPGQPYTLDFESLVGVASLYNSFLKKFAVENNHGVCDAAEKLEPSFENFYDDCHFNIAGSRKVGMIVSDCVEKYVAKTR